MTLAAWGLCATEVRGDVPESEAQQLHRRGVQCMDVIERPACAITNFEALLELRTGERALHADAMLRLIRLYRGAGDLDGAKPLLRRFWDAGVKRETRGHVPWSVRHLPAEVDVFFNVDIAGVAGAPLLQRVGHDLFEGVFTCDPARRQDLEDERRFERAHRKAAKTGRDYKAILYEELERDQAREARRAADRARGAKGPRGQPTPIVFEATCPVARLLGFDDLAGWQRLAGGMNHHDFGRSIAIAQLDGLEPRLARAVEQAQLMEIEPDHWRVPELRYEGDDVDLVRLDVGELVIAPPALADAMLAAKRTRERTLSRTLDGLIARVPRDTAFFLVLGEQAVYDFGLAGLEPAARNVLTALLPRPKGLQIAGLMGDDFGLFTRMPTDNPVKGRMLVSFARSLLDRSDDADDRRFLDGLDIAETKDRRALLASYVLSAAQIESLLLD